MRKLSFFALTGALVASAAVACNDGKPAVPARAKANLVSLFSGGDYPAVARAAREQGIVGFALDVGADGRVVNCEVTRPSGSAQLDDTTCRLLKSRARFTPALDADGTAVADKVAGRIDWILPPAPPAPL